VVFRNIPGYRVLLNTNSIYGNFMPRIPGFAQGRNFAFRDKHSGKLRLSKARLTMAA
jgi:hypothetical protein